MCWTKYENNKKILKTAAATMDNTIAASTIAFDSHAPLSATHSSMDFIQPSIHSSIGWYIRLNYIFILTIFNIFQKKNNNNNFYIEFNADDDDALCCKQQIIKQTTAAVSSWTLRDGWKDRRMDGWMFLFCYFLSLIIFSHIGANLFFAIVSFGVSIKKKNSKWMCCMWVCIFLYL